MEILNPKSTSSAAFIIRPGKEITLYAKGLSGSDTVVVEILELSEAPVFHGDACCDLTKARIEVVRRTPLLCPNGTPVALTAAYPFGTIDTPQGVALGVRLVADPSAVVTVTAEETSGGSGCMSCMCDRPMPPCIDATWTVTGETRCTPTGVQNKEESNCGTVRWAASTTPVKWTATGKTRCTATIIEAEEESQCGDIRWVATTIAVVWKLTGVTRCSNHLVENEEQTQCGETRWTPTTQTCGYCPSMRLSCDNDCSGFGYNVADPKDPAATVEMPSCATTADSIWIYPSAGIGHTIKITNCDGSLIGYAANNSDCAPSCGCA